MKQNWLYGEFKRAAVVEMLWRLKERLDDIIAAQ